MNMKNDWSSIRWLIAFCEELSGEAWAFVIKKSRMSFCNRECTLKDTIRALSYELQQFIDFLKVELLENQIRTSNRNPAQKTRQT